MQYLRPVQSHRRKELPLRGSAHAVVLGAGAAGTLAAAALARHVEHVTLVERDELPDGPRPRRGVPQAHHAHLLMAGGARHIESLLPGTLDRLVASGAHRIGAPNDLVSCTAQGWTRRSPEIQFIMACTRPLLDWTLRQALLDDERISVRTGVSVDGLDGHLGRVAAVRLHEPSTGEIHRLEADLVVDATGRGSAAERWLAELGVPAVPAETVDTGLAYATRLFRAPAGTEKGFPIVNVLAGLDGPHPGRGGVLLPVEDGRWMVTLSGMRDQAPPGDGAGFVEFARRLRHPVLAELIACARPDGPVRTTRSTANRRRRYDRLSAWPAGFVVTGDALASFNPVYGHGLSVAAKSAVTLRAALDRRGAGVWATAKGTRRLQRALAAAGADAWLLATGQDVFYPGAVGPSPGLAARVQRRYVERLMRSAEGRRALAAAVSDVLTLSAPLTRLFSPRVVAGTLLGPTGSPLTAPPFTADEKRVLQDAGR